MKLTQDDLAAAAAAYMAANGYDDDFEVMEEMIERDLVGEGIDALDGCIVEADGVCPHGFPSWLVYLGAI